jgi:hypothetical protein
MIILLRGHIRNSFDNQRLYTLLKALSSLYPLDIYIHTWHIVQSTISWRKLEENNTLVTEDYIYSYFKDLRQYIRHIIIDNDSVITHHGNTDGVIIQLPLIGWKNMWYGKFRIAEYCFQNVAPSLETQPLSDANPIVINLRFDVLCNSNFFALSNILKFVIQVNQYKKDSSDLNQLNRNIFMKNIPNCYGIDNIYIGNLYTMYKLSYHFHYHLDHILNIYKYNNKIKAQEGLVVLENRRIFSNHKNNINGFFHPKYNKKYVPTIYGKNTAIGMKYNPFLKIPKIPKENVMKRIKQKMKHIQKI